MNLIVLIGSGAVGKMTVGQVGGQAVLGRQL